MENDLLQSVSVEPPAKPARASSQHKQQSKQRTLSIGYGLNSNTNFYDIPVSDAFNEILERYVPPKDRPQRDVESDKQQKGLETMVMNNMWRSIAKYARQQIVQSEPTQVEAILRLWYVRLLALTKLGLCQLASAEFEKLGNLDRAELCDENNRSLVPFELRVLFATLPSQLKYPAVALERVTMLAVYCKKMQKKEKDNAIWKQREIQTYLVLATHWIGIKDYSAAATTMQQVLAMKPDNIDILSSLGRLYLQMGDLGSANQMFQRMEEKYTSDTTKEAMDMNKAFVLMAQGEWTQARDILQSIYQSNNENLLAINNLAVCEVYLGNLIKAIEILETLTLNNPTSAGTCETAIMNMCTLYELRYEDSTPKKIEVMKQVARWAGDSFQPDCLKLQ